MKKKIVMFAALSAALLLVGCKEVEQAAGQPAEGTEEIEEQIAIVEAETLPFVTPFTGERVAEEPLIRPIVVTINNHPQARPQSGLTEADVVYEMLAEGDVTRLLAVYQSDIPAVTGPVRSARSYFIDIANGLGAFYFAHGYSPEAKTMLERGVVDNMNGMQFDGTYFKRSSERKAPHNSYISGENIVAGIEKVGASILYQKKVSYPFYETQDNVKIGVKANQVTIKYSNQGAFTSQYVFDEVTNSYAKYAADVKTVDHETGEAVALANVLFFEMPHRIIDSVGRRDIDITGSGNAYIFQGGMMREVQWENTDGLLVAVEEDGTDVLLVPGQTWIHFVPTSPGLAASVTYTQ